MALTQIKFAPGVDKQDTSVGAIGRWTDSDNVRWRYGLPEKVGGWQSLLTDSIVCLLYTSPSPRDGLLSRMPSSA